MNKVILLVITPILLSACGANTPEYHALNSIASEDARLASDNRVAEITGLQGPEAVRYDAALDVYFIANFVGSSREVDANGFIIRVNAESGAVDSEFITGTKDFPLHAPRGMFITGDTLWVADAQGVHGFSKTSGEQLTFIDLQTYEPGFLNDVASDGRGSNFVTDTGGKRIYQFQHDGGHSEAANDIGNPNGITFNSRTGSFLIAPWTSGDPIRAWWPSLDSVSVYASPAGSSIDGIEVHNDRLIYAQQSDSTVRIYSDGEIVATIKTEGKPADIAVDTRRNRVAVPYIALDRVDIWGLPD
ncbi:MAG: hypothetical protein HKN43_05065 [Rhodothermales bacterium]|nr:hypothetical protein [Rhodothermales bacterium]